MASKKWITETEIEQYPIWKFDDKDDSFYPVKSLEDIPDDPKDLYFKASFRTPNNIQLKGVVVGLYRVFSIILFMGKKFYIFNYNLPDRANIRLKEIFSENQFFKSKNDIFPLQYITDMPENEGWKNFTGTFDVFHKELCKNEHSDKKPY